MEKQLTRSAFVGAMSIGLVFFGFSALAQTKYKSSSDPSVTYEAEAVLSACAPSWPPAGYVWTGGVSDWVHCKDVGTTGQRNIFTSYFDKSVGDSMRVCSPALPSGWVMISYTQDTMYVCGRDGTGGVGEPFYHNIWTIQKIQ